MENVVLKAFIHSFLALAIIPWHAGPFSSVMPTLKMHFWYRV